MVLRVRDNNPLGMQKILTKSRLVRAARETSKFHNILFINRCCHYVVTALKHLVTSYDKHGVVISKLLTGLIMLDHYHWRI